MALRPDQIEDIDELTQKYFEKDEYIDLSLNFNNFHMTKALQGGGRKIARSGGTKLNWKLQVRNLGSFQLSGLFATHTTENQDLMKQAEVEWTKQIVGYNWDVDEEAFNEPDEVRILEAMKVRIHSCWNDWYLGMEKLMWTAPTSSSQDPLPPYGVPFWFTYAGATSTYGLNGGNPSGFSSGAGGLSSTTYPAWANGNFTYATIDDDDCLLKLAEALDKGEFQAPHSYEELGKGKPDWCMYTVYQNIQVMRKLQKNQNDNIGRDLGEYSGNVTFRRIPIYWVSALDTDSTQPAYDATNRPIYGINWRKFHYVLCKGKDMVKSPAIIPANQPSVRERFMWRWGNFRCYDRRTGGFAAKFSA